MSKLRAAVIGLGQAGSRFDEEPRPAVWSHVGAYLALAGHYELAGGADGRADRRERFQRRCPGLPAYGDEVELLTATRPDVVSICTPHQGRGQLVERLLAAHRPKALICEKPLETDAARREKLVALCREAGVPLLVHYNRRYLTAYRHAKTVAAEGRLGRLTSITVAAPNRLWSIGSHALNTLLFLAGQAPAAWTALPLPGLAEGGEPAADFLCRFASGAAGRVVTTGFRRELVFEADMLGEAGRLCVLDNGARVVYQPFVDSPEYVGYKVLGPEATWHVADPRESSFVAIAEEAAELAGGRSVAVASSAEDALASETILDDMVRSATRDPSPP